MKRIYKSWVLAAILMAALLGALAPRAAAQTSISGKIIGPDGKPWADIVMRSVDSQGAKQETKTDKDGNYAFRNLRTGVYSVFVVFPPPNTNPPYEVKKQLQSGEDAKVDLNFQEIIAKLGAANPEATKKAEEAKSKFEGMRAHFTAGLALLEQEKAAKAELQKAAADQRDDLSNQAAAEFQAAEKSAPEKDANLHKIWARLGEAYDTAGRNEEAAQAYQQAISAKPDEAGYYNNMGNVLARAGKIEEAKAAYTKSAELDPANAAGAWLNFGISLSNAGRLKEALEPLKKSTELDPKNAKAWYLLATALVGAMEAKKVGDKLEFIVQPGTIEAYQKAVELDGNGIWGQQAKQGLDGLQQIAPGIDTKVNVKKKKP